MQNGRITGGLRSGQLHGGGACVQRRTQRDKESSRRGGRVADITRFCRMGRRRRWWRKVEWTREGSVGCQRARPSPGLRRRPRGGENWAVGRRGAGGKFQHGAFLRLPQPMPRAEAGAQILVPGIGQTGPRPKKFTAPAGGTFS
jgi:hypothetical protein